MKPIEALRTPEARFQSLPAYEYKPHYVDSLSGYEGLRGTISIWDRRTLNVRSYSCMATQHGAISIAKRFL